MPRTQRISANAIGALKDALTAGFWFKKDLYEYAKAAVAGEPLFLAGIEWTSSDQYKRDSVSTFVDRLVREQDEHQPLLLALLVDVSEMTEFPQLARTDDPEAKVAAARAAVARLKDVVEPYEKTLMDARAAKDRIDIAKRAAEDRRATTHRLAELKQVYFEVMSLQPHARGFKLEPLLGAVFEAFDLNPRGSFKIVGEQIDGGFSLDGEHFLVEAKWQKDSSARDELDVFTMKVRRRGENTLGLFVAIEGFQPTAISVHSGDRSPILLMDGADLFAVLDDRIDLRALLQRKRREASMTGRAFIGAAEILTGRRP